MEREVRVTQGGFFHTKKVDYSPETQRLLKELIRESKLNIHQRKLINETVKKGEPLPMPPKKVEPPKIEKESHDVRKIYLPRRRKKDQIIMYTADDAECIFRHQTPVDYTQEKRRLQDLMAFGKTIKTSQDTGTEKMVGRNRKEKIESERKSEKITRILKEIEEREHFLAEMKRLGQSKKYESIINQEISAKLRALEDIDSNLKAAIKDEYKESQDIKAVTNSLFRN